MNNVCVFKKSLEKILEIYELIYALMYLHPPQTPLFLVTLKETKVMNLKLGRYMLIKLY